MMLQGFQSSTSQEGTIVKWVDEKGYGWVKFGEKRFFTHIKDFEPGQRRPKAGEVVRFIQAMDAKGRMCAKNVTFVKSGGRIGAEVLLLLTALLVLPLLALLWLPFPWWQGVGAMVLMSAVTYGMYQYDKQQAVSAGWRTRESSLHLAEMLGGWPGALLAQKRLRHKCSKAGYQFVFWSIVTLYQVTAMDVILDQRLSRALLALIKR